MTHEPDDHGNTSPAEGLSTEVCAETREALRSAWHNSAPERTPDTDMPSIVIAEESIERHLRTCPACRQEAEDMRRVDTALRLGFDRITGSLSPPTRECLDALIRRVRAESPEARFRVRMGRALRTVLWGALWALTLAAFSLVALAAYRAIRGIYGA
jgi:hypothetical protein